MAEGLKGSPMLQKLTIQNYTTQSGIIYSEIPLSYQLFGRELFSAPIVLVNHALTGNSNVAGKNGWWQDLIGDKKSIDTRKYTVLAFNIPGNGYDGFIIENYKDFVSGDIARIFLKGLELLKIKRLYAIIGGSLGGGLAWEMAALSPEITEHLIPVASDYKATDWLIANCQIQEQFLFNSKQPLHDARMHAMLCYRTPESFKERFQRTKHDTLGIFNVESWLLHHGKKLQERFQLAAYKLMNHLLKTIDATRNSGTEILEAIKADIHIVGVDSDLFFTAKENRETQKLLALTHPNVTYHEIHSVHGHDAFLIEYSQLEKIIDKIFNPQSNNKKLKILKFGGKSLANGKGINQVVSIIREKVKHGNRIAVVASARGQATDELETILNLAASGKDYKTKLEKFKNYQQAACETCDFSTEFRTLDRLLEGVKLLRHYSKKIKDEVLSQGELLSIKLLAEILQQSGIDAVVTDTRKLIKTDENFGNAQPIDSISKKNVTEHFKQNNGRVVNIVSGFIASNLQDETTTLGRNGSNYTAALLANYLNAEELENYTHVSGIYTANPSLVSDAKKIKELSYNEANELANFGTTILHAKTIIPLIEKNINLRILNTFQPEDEGTLITSKSHQEGIKSISVLSKMALLNLEGRGLLGKPGIDARIFKALGMYDISVSIISQGSSERGIGLVIDADKAKLATKALEREFEKDFYTKDVNQISILDNVSVISIVGMELKHFHKPFNLLIKNQVEPLLFNNTVTGKNVSLIVKDNQLKKAVNIIHSEIFGIAKRINLAIFGHGLVGGALIEQITDSAKEITRKKGIKLNIFAIANSKKVLLDRKGIGKNWRNRLADEGSHYTIKDIIEFASDNHLENLIAIDNTASKEFVENYISLVKNGFDLVSSNKIANTIGLDYYHNLRKTLDKYQKRYLYETNVGAGLPLIDTIQLLHLSGENITRIKGVFSGSLSYLFNTFSAEDKPFSAILNNAIESGYTEPDAREDLSGNDVARKLLILARELDLSVSFEDVKIENLIPKHLRTISVKKFIKNITDFDVPYQNKKAAQNKNHVLRYVGDLHGNLSKSNGAILEVKLISVPAGSPLGQVKGSDSIFEIFTESYGEQPIVIQGAGAGAAVTARGVFGDILRLADKVE